MKPAPIALLTFPLLLCRLGAPLAAQESAPEPVAHTTVGMRVHLEEFPLPGTQLKARPVADPGRADALVRIVNVFPHGSGFRYNLEITPFVPGTIELGPLLERVDGSSTDDLPTITIAVDRALPDDRLEPNPLTPATQDRIGGYTVALIVGGVVWLLGLIAILTVGRRRKSAQDAAADGPPTLADRLRPLVEQARTGEMDHGQQAELERLLLAHWRERRQLGAASAAEAMAALRRDPEAGPLLQHLERWLHRPADAGDAPVDLGELLEPYRHVQAPPVAETEAAV